MARRLPVVAFLAVLLVGAVALAVPYLTAARSVISATPSPPPLVTPARVQLPADETACLRIVTFDRDSEVVAFELARPPRPGTALTVSVAAPGYRTRATARPVERAVRVPITPPRAPAIGRLCLANTGRPAIELLATGERSAASRPVVSVRDRTIRADVVLSLLERDRSSYVARAGDILRHASTYAFVPAILWVLAVLLLGGVPLGILWGLTASLRDER